MSLRSRIIVYLGVLVVVTVVLVIMPIITTINSLGHIRDPVGRIRDAISVLIAVSLVLWLPPEWLWTPVKGLWRFPRGMAILFVAVLLFIASIIAGSLELSVVPELIRYVAMVMGLPVFLNMSLGSVLFIIDMDQPQGKNHTNL